MITIRREYSYISWFAIVLPASMCMWRTAIATIPKTFSAVVFRIAETITNVMRQWRCAWIQCSWRFSRSQCGCSFRFFRFRGLKTNAGLKKNVKSSFTFKNSTNKNTFLHQSLCNRNPNFVHVEGSSLHHHNSIQHYCFLDHNDHHLCNSPLVIHKDPMELQLWC